ncbi:MAG: adenosine deaminase, partial [Anaerolineae bacterium]|nr:adenosine deaminase [Anaerolineae bacterium]
IAHAGEACGPENIWQTLAYLRPARIGHGVRCIEDSALVTHLVAEGIHLEVCPACNVQINIYDTVAEHPIDRLHQAGISIGINTDARGVTPTTLGQDYAQMIATFGWTAHDFLTCNQNAAAASFAPPALKDRLAQQLAEGYSV